MAAVRTMALCNHTLAVTPSTSATVDARDANALSAALPSSMPRTPNLRQTNCHTTEPATRPMLDVTTSACRVTSPSAARRVWKVVPNRIGTNVRWVMAYRRNQGCVRATRKPSW
ncbi:hypothetical protein BST36_04410 [Mycolicibacterium moriokaense]|jgi:hypothetical protein|uniref:Uncharacterized protein n=1 Tax=Mycolicibacterium moriokaense TaxID=39691 RepID=A0AAD1HCR5_9MYCO|nr:hypothetical protein [Mycolicibacterium moriokaense]MCV7040733.1 hypothetical protein [Mycolicibacterium moriokaense]ORB26479.1 hypothetical protein BST36_04410 [Mycolicibacterium moriokaense]BBX02965.1 hypothetical protein MMOR_39010 [Mycolicibacterium moriokaense]